MAYTYCAQVLGMPRLKTERKKATFLKDGRLLQDGYNVHGCVGVSVVLKMTLTSVCTFRTKPRLA